MKICIDAGHGGKFNNATSYDGVQEKTENLTNALALQSEMQRRGHTVVMTRTTDVELGSTLGADLDKRCAIANNAGCDCFVSLHENGYRDPDANGVETIHGTNASTKSKQWAQDCLDRLAVATGLKKRSVLMQGITVLTKTKMPAILVEFGFMTNVGDMTAIRNNRAVFISAIADSTEAMFGAGTQKPVAPTPQPTAPPSSVPKLTRNLRKGSNGEDVRQAQARLNKHKANAGKEDGAFGTNTYNATVRFQKARIAEGRDLGTSGADGVIGPKTWAILWE